MMNEKYLKKINKLGDTENLPLIYIFFWIIKILTNQNFIVGRIRYWVWNGAQFCQLKNIETKSGARKKKLKKHFAVAEMENYLIM